MKIQSLLIILLLLLKFIAFAQNDDLKFEHLTIADGLPGNNVDCILQDHLGYMWFGTRNGLVKYDGYSMKVFQPDPNDSQSISDRRVFCICEDKTGNLWMGTVSGGVNLFHRETETFTRYMHNPDDSTSINSNAILIIYENKNGDLFVGTINGFDLFDKNTKNFKHIIYRGPVYSPTVYKYISSLIAKGKQISSILRVGNNANLTRTFSIDKKTIVLKVIMGEPGFDDGWLESENGKIIEGKKVYDAVFAGGHTNNLIKLEIDTLYKGNYRLRYISDYVYSYDNLSQPDYSDFWGIQVIELPEWQSSVMEIFNNIEASILDYYGIAIIQDQLTGNIYVGHYGKNLILNKEELCLIDDNKISELKSNIGGISSFLQTNDGTIWIGHSKGLAKYTPLSNVVKCYQLGNSMKFRVENSIARTVQDENGLIWCSNTWGPSDVGLVCFNPESEQFKIYKSDPNKKSSLSNNAVWSVYIDHSGILWVGTGGGGLNKWNKIKKKFKRFIDDSNGKQLNTVYTFLEDKQGIIWLGTDNGLYSFNRQSSEFRNYRYDRKNKNNTVLDIYIDEAGIIWFATSTRGLGSFDSGKRSFHFYSNNPNDSMSISINKANYILPEGRDVLWIGTSGGGLNKFNKKTKKFTVFKHVLNNPKSLSSNNIKSIYNDRRGNLWIGTVNRLNLFDRTDKFFRSFNSATTTIYEDRNENFWLGTTSIGLCLFNRDKGTMVYNISAKDGLSNNVVRSILEDDSGNLWIGTEYGLSKFDPESRRIRNYYTSDVLNENKYFRGSACKTSTGEMLFGTYDGFIMFHPDSIKDDPVPPKVVINNVSLFNRPGEKLEFDGFISEMKELKLMYNENDLRFDYVGLHYGDPSKNRYKYKLEGYDKDWEDAATQRNATYTNLDAGDYIFRVISCNADGIWNEEGASIKIIILPPWWATTWAYLIYALLTISLIYFLWKLQLKRVRNKHELEMSRFEAEKMHEVDELKSRFFANISHEFRTPLTLIFGPANDVMEETNEPKTKKKVSTIRRNASRLYGLVNQLLDLSKLEAGKMKLEASEQNIIPLLKGLVLSFTSLSERKKIALTFNSTTENLNVYIDKEKVEKIINNLLSNAFKFTPEGGKIDFTVEKIINEVEIRITDNGIGISEERIDKIFDRFYQVNGSHTREGEGTGIGLALTKELVELHKGRIMVESKEKEGTTFTVKLPLGKDHLKAEEIVGKQGEVVIPEQPEQVIEPENGKEKTEIDVLLDTDKALLLIVEDNPDVRSYIIGHLEDDYRIQEAVDGEDGLEQALKHIPDLIISDVMMPKMDGFEMCEKLKTDEKTSHIPIIILTAKATSKDKIEGYETGADDYIMKPFDAAELKVRIKNLIEIRKKLQEKFSSDGFNLPKELSSIDEQFMKRVLKAINDHISEEEFSVEELGKEAAISRVYLHRKLKALTGKSPSLFIRSIRLNRAKRLLTENGGTIAEVAYNFGFGSPAYFTKCFKKEFGCLPSELVK